MDKIYFQDKPIIIRVHAIKRAREREIAYPDQVHDVLQTGKVNLGYCIIIKTIERGN